MWGSKDTVFVKVVLLPLEKVFSDILMVPPFLIFFWSLLISVILSEGTPLFGSAKDEIHFTISVHQHLISSLFNLPMLLKNSRFIHHRSAA